jgi:hypothetical protein
MGINFLRLDVPRKTSLLLAAVFSVVAPVGIGIGFGLESLDGISDRQLKKLTT